MLRRWDLYEGECCDPPKRLRGGAAGTAPDRQDGPYILNHRRHPGPRRPGRPSGPSAAGVGIRRGTSPPPDRRLFGAVAWRGVERRPGDGGPPRALVPQSEAVCRILPAIRCCWAMSYSKISPDYNKIPRLGSPEATNGGRHVMRCAPPWRRRPLLISPARPACPSGRVGSLRGRTSVKSRQRSPRRRGPIPSLASNVGRHLARAPDRGGPTPPRPRPHGGHLPGRLLAPEQGRARAGGPLRNRSAHRLPRLHMAEAPPAQAHMRHPLPLQRL